MPMRKLLTSLIALVTVLISIFPKPFSTKASLRKSPTRICAPGEIIVKLKASVNELTSYGEQESRQLLLARELGEQIGSASAERLIEHAPNEHLRNIISRHGLDRTFVMKFDPDSDLSLVISKLMASGAVEYAEPNYLIKPGDFVPDDPYFDQQWGLRNLGIGVDGNSSTLGADIKAVDAWAITTGSPNVIVAVTDTGVDINHPDLAPNIYTNPREIPGNGIDDDGNGYVDDVHGYNTAEQNGDVSDVLGHGTQVAGIIAAVTNNHMGISGVSQSKLLPVKFYKRTGPNPDDVDGTVADAARAIIYSIAAGASIINASWSTLLLVGEVPESSARALEDAVRASNDAGVLLVCIAGNEGFNNDYSAVYPGHYGLPNQIVVAASDYNDEIWRDYFRIISGFGPKTVHLAAPGVSIFTTKARGNCRYCSDSDKPEDWYTHERRSGTSYSAAFVSGVAALVKSKYPEASATVIRNRILQGVDVIDGLRNYVVTSGRLNALGALTVQLSITPPILRRVKYKAGPEKLLLFGDHMQRGAEVLIDDKSYPTSSSGDDLSLLIARVPASTLPIGTTVLIRLRNPDGGLSAPISFSR
jgi:subtilisin family serine protease